MPLIGFRAFALCGALLLILPSRASNCTNTGSHSPSSNIKYLNQEVKFLASQGSRLTGSPAHNALVDRIKCQLEQLGLTVQTDTLTFTYFDGPLSDPSFKVGAENVPVTSYSKYSGYTLANGISGELIDLTTSSINKTPNWTLASGGIALANLTNLDSSGKINNNLWPGSPPYPPMIGNPEGNTEIFMSTLGDAARAGVKGTVWAWENASTGLVDGMWSPFHNLYQGVPSLFVQGGYGGLEELKTAAKNKSKATLTLHAKMVPNTPARTLWVVFEGRTVQNESMLINTHTDGTNTVEENGWIALMAKAADLAANPPNRTTVLIFAGQHLQYEAFNPYPMRATSRWLYDHPEYWAGEGNSKAFELGGQLQAVAGTCVEHMGAVYWDQNLENNTYYTSNRLNPELLYAATVELDSLVRKAWQGAEPNITRVTNPSKGQTPQGGEGYPFYLFNIPNISLITDPTYLLKIWPENFDTSTLVDLEAMKRQIESFFRIWTAMDGMSAEEFGKQPVNGSNSALHSGSSIGGIYVG